MRRQEFRAPPRPQVHLCRCSPGNTNNKKVHPVAVWATVLKGPPGLDQKGGTCGQQDRFSLFGAKPGPPGEDEMDAELIGTPLDFPPAGIHGAHVRRPVERPEAEMETFGTGTGRILHRKNIID